jgi:hypothetical protein
MCRFVTVVIARKPDFKELGPNEISALLNSSPAMQKEGVLTKAWSLGAYLCKSYTTGAHALTLGSYAWKLYQQPTALAVVSGGVRLAASWILLLIQG